MAVAAGTSTVMVPPTVTRNKRRRHFRRRLASGDGCGTAIIGFAPVFERKGSARCIALGARRIGSRSSNRRRQPSGERPTKIGAAEPCAVSYYSSALWRCSVRFASGAAVLTAFVVTRNQWRADLIERGFANYNERTGKWEWGEQASIRQ